MLDELRKKLMATDHELTDEQVMAYIEDVVLSGKEELPFDEYGRVVKRLYARLRSKLGILDLYMKDTQVNEIMINGPDTFFFERWYSQAGGKLCFSGRVGRSHPEHCSCSTQRNQ